MQNVLITGAAGDIGTRLRKILRGVYPRLRASDIRKPLDLAAGDDFIAADLTDLAQVEKAVAGMEGIIHLGGHAVEGSWETILNANIIGCYKLFDVARPARAKGGAFGSSTHASGFYPRAQRIGVDVRVRPDSRYGVSKAFGEALGSLYADKHGLRVTCLRIGNITDTLADERRLSIWVNPEDLAQLMRIGLEPPDIHFEIFYGVSDNAASFWDNSRAAHFGYRPQGRAEDYRREALAAQAKLPPDPIGARYQGGPFCSAEYDADKRT